MLSEIEKSIISKIKGSKCLHHIEKICAYPDRFIGTPGDKESLSYISDFFKEHDLEVRETKIKVPTFIEQEPAGLVNVDTGDAYEAIPPYFSGSTSADGITAEVVPVSEGEEEGYRGKDVKGKIVLVMETGLGFSKFWLGTFAERAARKGAVGLIVIHPMPWAYRMSMEAGNSKIENRFCEQSVPAVCISSIDGAKLLFSIGQGKSKVHMKVNTLIEERESIILSGIKKGTNGGEKRIGLIGHRDNGIAPGANDNLSGTACMLELAEILTRENPKKGFEFISSTAEEGVTIGAWSYCQQHREELKENMELLIDIDMVSVGSMIKQVEKGLWPDSDPLYQPDKIMTMVDEIAEDLGYYFGRMTAGWGVAESGRFLEIGVPAIWFWAPDDPYYHSSHDSPDKVNPINLKGVSDVVAVLMWRLANTEE